MEEVGETVPRSYASSPTPPISLTIYQSPGGGIVSDHNDGWIMGYCRYLGNIMVVDAELWGILNGLNLISNRSFEKVVIQPDSIKAVNAIQEGFSGTSNSALVRRILIILKALNPVEDSAYSSRRKSNRRQFGQISSF
ncbi:hypothetical protein CXB51_024398 [Gossypium anomalum]|uniref:RNase H type-1 domain-containing protein n=1 Tax=Gossypium anomalum TaxID=47600 RepID=A0A8J5YGA2_9ROSI|nr:hypothetical protein CXB51_024398 [Gossypium anomalum]